MARTSRKKSSSNIHHIMSKGISEIQLFRDSNDKNKFLHIVEKYKKAYMFIIYSYVLMDTHYHLQINDNGADISKFMKSINQSYAQYYNKKYNRHGHVFSDRFKSKPVENDRYAVAVSVYIHNNPKDIISYKNSIKKYRYSSFQAYLGINSRFSNLTNVNFILNYFSSNLYKARNLYSQLVLKSPLEDVRDDFEFTKKEPTYNGNNHILIRNFNPEKIITFIKSYTSIPLCIQGKYNHKNTEAKCICVFLLRSLCNVSLSDISSIFGNVTNSNIWRLCEKGMFLIGEDVRYKNIIKDFIHYNKIS